MNLALNNLQRLVCHKTQPTNQPTNQLKFETKPKFLCLPYTKQRKFFFFTEKEVFKEKGEWKIEQKMKRVFFVTVFTTAIKKEPHNVNKKASW